MDRFYSFNHALHQKGKRMLCHLFNARCTISIIHSYNNSEAFKLFLQHYTCADLFSRSFAVPLLFKSDL